MLKNKQDQILTIRPSKNEEEVALAMGWAIEEGWNVGKYDAQAYYRAFPAGCQLLILDEQPIGAIFLANYGKELVFIGLFIIDKNYRHKGYGKQLWDHAMQAVANKMSVGLYAVPVQVSRYKSSGFETSHDILRWQTQASPVLSLSNDTYSDDAIKQIALSNAQLVAEVGQYESNLFPLPRIALIKALLEIQQVVGFVMKESGQVVGYGLIRPCQAGFRIGPLYANDFEAAKALTTKLLEIAKHANKEAIVDTPPLLQNKFVTAFVEYFNLQRIKDADTHAMFKGEVPKVLATAFERNYAVCSLELG